jgi:hypothetical protein
MKKTITLTIEEARNLYKNANFNFKTKIYVYRYNNLYISLYH